MKKENDTHIGTSKIRPHVNKTLNWEHSDIQLEELFIHEEWNRIISYVSDNERLLFRKWMEDEHQFLDKSLKAGSFYMTPITNIVTSDEKDNTIFKLGALYGMVKLLGRQVHNEKEELYSAQIAEKSLSSVKHLDSIILLLEQNGTLTHSALAKKLDNMKTSTLTENMRKVVDRGLVYTHVIGRYKQYYLTDYGRSYARNLRRRKNSELDIKSVESAIVSWLNDSEKAKPTYEMLERLINPKDDTKQEDLNRKAFQKKTQDIKIIEIKRRLPQERLLYVASYIVDSNALKTYATGKVVLNKQAPEKSIYTERNEKINPMNYYERNKDAVNNWFGCPIQEAMSKRIAPV